MNGQVVARELYYMACSACSIEPDVSVPLSTSGSALAYSSLLGADIDSGWTSEFTYPGSNPKRVGELWYRALMTQPPDANIVSESNKVRFM